MAYQFRIDFYETQMKCKDLDKEGRRIGHFREKFICLLKELLSKESS
jgi:hypothetical protein